MKERYNFSKIWVSKIIESNFPNFLRTDNPLLSSALKLGVIPTIIIALHIFMRKNLISPGFLLAYIFINIWLILAPYFIWYYDEVLFPKFFANLIDLLPNEKKLKIARTYDTLFSKMFWVTSIPWISLLAFIYLNSSAFFLKGGFINYNDPMYWLGFIIVIWIGILAGIGSWGALVTIFMLEKLAKEKISIDPLHPDRRGGLSCIGQFIIKVSLLLSSGALVIPMAFEIVEEKLEIYVYIAIAMFIASITLPFIYPTFKIGKTVRKIRDDILEEIRREYYDIESLVRDTKEDFKKLVLLLSLSEIREKYRMYENLKLYPFEIEIFIKLLSSLILPVLFVLLEVYLFKTL